MFDECGASASPLGDLSDEEFMVWTGFLHSYAAVARGLDADLQAIHGLPLTEFEILLWLSRKSCTRMRMAGLAEMVQLSPSGLSRAIERLEGRGLVRRDRCTEDRRGAFAVLTPRGSELVDRASATQAAGIKRRFLNHLTSEEMEMFGHAWERVLAGNERSCVGTGDVLSGIASAECAPEEGDGS